MKHLISVGVAQKNKNRGVTMETSFDKGLKYPIKGTCKDDYHGGRIGINKIGTRFVGKSRPKLLALSKRIKKQSRNVTKSTLEWWKIYFEEGKTVKAEKPGERSEWEMAVETAGIKNHRLLQRKVYRMLNRGLARWNSGKDGRIMSKLRAYFDGQGRTTMAKNTISSDDFIFIT
ncbi:hypothetical protein Tco_1098025 [Tanacetum coccineum]